MYDFEWRYMFCVEYKMMVLFLFFRRFRFHSQVLGMNLKSVDCLDTYRCF